MGEANKRNDGEIIEKDKLIGSDTDTILFFKS